MKISASQKELKKQELTKLKEIKLAELEENTNSLIIKRFPRFEQCNLAKGRKIKIKDRIIGEYLTASQLEQTIKQIKNIAVNLSIEIKATKTKAALEEIEISPNKIHILTLEDKVSTPTKLSTYLSKLFS